MSISTHVVKKVAKYGVVYCAGIGTAVVTGLGGKKAKKYYKKHHPDEKATAKNIASSIIDEVSEKISETADNVKSKVKGKKNKEEDKKVDPIEDGVKVTTIEDADGNNIIVEELGSVPQENPAFVDNDNMTITVDK